MFISMVTGKDLRDWKIGGPKDNPARRNLLRMIQSLPESKIPFDIKVSLFF